MAERLAALERRDGNPVPPALGGGRRNGDFLRRLRVGQACQHPPFPPAPLLLPSASYEGCQFNQGIAKAPLTPWVLQLLTAPV